MWGKASEANKLQLLPGTARPCAPTSSYARAQGECPARLGWAVAEASPLLFPHGPELITSWPGCGPPDIDYGSEKPQNGLLVSLIADSSKF